MSELETLFPAAELPKLPQAPTGSRFGGRAASTPAKPAGEPRQASKPGSKLTVKQTRMFAAMGAGAIILIAVVLAIAGVFSGDGEGSAPAAGDETASTAGETVDPSTPIPDGEEISRVPLAPPNGGKAGGAAVVGIAAESQPYLDLVLSNLPDPPKNQTYLAWFMFTEDEGYPMTEPIIPQNGSYENRLAIPLEVADPISRATAIEISLSDPNDIVKSIQGAAQAGVFQIERPGETVLVGNVPRGSAGGGEDQQAPGEAGG